MVVQRPRKRENNQPPCVDIQAFHAYRLVWISYVLLSFLSPFPSYSSSSPRSEYRLKNVLLLSDLNFGTHQRFIYFHLLWKPFIRRASPLHICITPRILEDGREKKVRLQQFPSSWLFAAKTQTDGLEEEGGIVARKPPHFFVWAPCLWVHGQPDDGDLERTDDTLLGFRE